VDPTNIAIFLLSFAAFVVLTRKLFSSERPTYSEGFPPPPYPDRPDEYRSEELPAVTGAELPFPVSLPPLQLGPDGKYNRPKILNYYFSEIDLVRGPENRTSFCDELLIQFEAAETGQTWTNRYVVATPAGLEDQIRRDHNSLFIDDCVVVVSEWNLAEILRTIMDDVMEHYQSSDRDSAEIVDDPRRYQA
jgi:hypothetical protein